MATVMDPDVRDAGDSSRKAQEILAGAAVLVCDQQALIGCAALKGEAEVGLGPKTFPSSALSQPAIHTVPQSLLPDFKECKSLLKTRLLHEAFGTTAWWCTNFSPATAGLVHNNQPRVLTLPPLLYSA